MRILTSLVTVFWICSVAVADGPRLTIYNQDFAVVRDTVTLDLTNGISNVSFSDVAAHLEPDSVILRSLDPDRQLRVLEQNYRADPLSQPMLLSIFEGETIDFLVGARDGDEQIVRGKIIRSGYVRHRSARFNFNRQYYARQTAYSQGPQNQPIIEVAGRLQFMLPGTPLFPSLPDDSVLKPTLNWVLESDRAGSAEIELSYITGGMAWAADYNLVSPAEGNTLDLTGWVTMDNQSGKSYENAQIKLMAGDVNKFQPARRNDSGGFQGGGGGSFQPTVTEKTFDEYHLYTLARPTTLRDRETKQVEFLRATGIESKQVYVYDGVYIEPNQYGGWTPRDFRRHEQYGTQSNPKIWVMREFENSEENGLGIPLPKGRLRFYRKDGDQLEFVGEDAIDHTPRDETVRAYTGNAFDIVGKREQTSYDLGHVTTGPGAFDTANILDESFRIALRNHKDEAVEVRVVEHLYRWANWNIAESSHPYEKKDSREIEFLVQIPADGSVEITYWVHYEW